MKKLGLLLFLFFFSALIQAADIKQYCPWLTANADKWQFIYRAEEQGYQIFGNKTVAFSRHSIVTTHLERDLVAWWQWHDGRGRRTDFRLVKLNQYCEVPHWQPLDWLGTVGYFYLDNRGLWYCEDEELPVDPFGQYQPDSTAKIFLPANLRVGQSWSVSQRSTLRLKAVSLTEQGCQLILSGQNNFDYDRDVKVRICLAAGQGITKVTYHYRQPLADDGKYLVSEQYTLLAIKKN